jgi:hypothetical protein
MHARTVKRPEGRAPVTLDECGPSFSAINQMPVQRAVPHPLLITPRGCAGNTNLVEIRRGCANLAAMQSVFTGPVYVVRDNIDTDQIIPAQHLNLVPTIPDEYEKLGSFAL